MTFCYEKRLLEASIDSAQVRIEILEASLNTVISLDAGAARLQQVDRLRTNIREWQRLLDSIERLELDSMIEEENS